MLPIMDATLHIAFDVLFLGSVVDIRSDSPDVVHYILEEGPSKVPILVEERSVALIYKSFKQIHMTRVRLY